MKWKEEEEKKMFEALGLLLSLIVLFAILYIDLQQNKSIRERIDKMQVDMNLLNAKVDLMNEKHEKK